MAGHNVMFMNFLALHNDILLKVTGREVTQILRL
jgi:hypothetical protein